MTPAKVATASALRSWPAGTAGVTFQPKLGDTKTVLTSATQLLADFLNPGTLALLIPIIALLIPIVGLLVKHQQKMTELMQQGRNDNQVDAALLHELQALRAEVSSLKETVNQQAIALDDVRPLATREVQERIGDSNG